MEPEKGPCKGYCGFKGELYGVYIKGFGVKGVRVRGLWLRSLVPKLMRTAILTKA